jgi:hypothetical protein
MGQKGIGSQICITDLTYSRWKLRIHYHIGCPSSWYHTENVPSLHIEEKIALSFFLPRVDHFMPKAGEIQLNIWSG